MQIRISRIKFFEKIIADFFQKVGREHLPWRKKKISAYEVWVSEIMLQQTQVSRVIEYYVRFLEKFPTIEALAKSDWEEFLPYYEGLGYYARGRNMLKAAKVIMEEHGGKFPQEKKLLEGIPGIGPYTASAIMSFAYGENHLAWDTNLKRVIGRFFLGSKKVDLSVSFRPSLRVEESHREELAPSSASRRIGMTIAKYLENSFSLPAKMLNAALMDFGSAICVARPKCEACPLRMRCVYYKEKGVNELRANGLQTKQKENWKEAQAFVFLHENHQKYFSPQKKRYEPFIMGAGYNSRAGIKDWFQKNHGLIVSVRPPHKKLSAGNGPALLVNVQILSGSHDFAVFSKKDYQEYTRDMISSF